VRGFYVNSCDNIMLKTGKDITGNMLFPIGHLKQKHKKTVTHRYVEN
jgi:hypothetical protein